jgi:hypothetical protein
MSMTAGIATMTISATGLVLSAVYGGMGLSAALIVTRGARFVANTNAALAAAAAAQSPTANPLFTSVPATAPNGFPSVANYQTQANTLCLQCQDDANAIVPYIQANAVATVSTSLGGLQTSASSGSPTTAPSTTHTIPIF